MIQGAIISIDTKEPPHIKNLTWDGTLAHTRSLEFGDIEIIVPDGQTILIERKSINDFFESIKDGRLFNQVAGMVKKTPFCYVAIGGTLASDVDGITLYGDAYHREWIKSGWQWSSIQGILLSIQELGCGVVYYRDFHDCVQQIATRSRGAVKIPPRREPQEFTQAEIVLTSLPGIGLKKARQVLEYCGLVSLALEWLTDLNHKHQIQGIGKKTKQKIIDTLSGQLFTEYER